eukprot:CAMPEP_0206018576 /NCGR_PEP_ID=MMETSP1464-20131121/27414_1 /ASSEMBLY_ACC=CAM_ASM_001124 /TAXON_ID=119497 /ORGANISM="Exanthemachrysis gayraliae, Strain RCC1523" /LENGTH=51 /DNA_ID=CAMNT_0053392453 /DNA_START=16 /DNA_END=167 /DNA_ORIENTATION=+
MNDDGARARRPGRRAASRLPGGVGSPRCLPFPFNCAPPWEAGGFQFQKPVT